MAIALDPSICTRKSKHYVAVECDGVYTRGQTVVDQLGVTPYDTANVAAWQPIVGRGEPHVTICWEIDTPLEGSAVPIHAVSDATYALPAWGCRRWGVRDNRVWLNG